MRLIQIDRGEIKADGDVISDMDEREKSTFSI